MTQFETGLFAATLLVVPVLAWVSGRMMGRRNWRVLAVVAGGCVVALVPHLVRIAVLAAMEPQALRVALPHQAMRTLDNPEVGLFFVTLGIFITMLGWTATPAQPTALAAARSSVR